MLIDMHVNAVADDGTPRDPKKTFEQAAQVGLDGVLVVGTPETLDRQAWLDARGEDDPLVFFAVPVRTRRGTFLCVPRRTDDECVPAEWTRTDRRETVDETSFLARVHDRRLAVIAVQPYVRVANEQAVADLVFSLEGIHAVEVRTLGADPMAVDLAVEAALGMRLPCLAGSGDRKKDPVLGTLASLFAVRVEDQSGLVDALLSGDAWPVQIERGRERKGGPKGGPPRGSGPQAGPAPDGPPPSGPGPRPGGSDEGEDEGKRRRRRRRRSPQSSED